MIKYIKPVSYHFFQLIVFIIFLKILGYYGAGFGAIGAYAKKFLVFEIPLLILFYFSIFSLLKESKYQYYLAALPIYLFYLFFNVFYIFFGRIFKLVDVDELPELIDVLPASNILTILIFTIFIIGLYGIAISYKKLKYRLIFVVPVFILFMSIQIKPGLFVSAVDSVLPEISRSSERASARDNGYLSFMLYSEARRVTTLEKLREFRDRDNYVRSIASFSNSLDLMVRKRNVHIIVLESFLDPLLFKELGYSSNPISKNFFDFFQNKESISISPVFGGGTAQAEFEILCGVPAFAIYRSIEFNVFSGAKAYCMPEILKSIGYRVLASNAYKPDYFNQVLGYKGIGFDEINFPTEYAPTMKSYFSKNTSDTHMSDGALLKQNFEYIRKHIKNNPKIPLLNYVIGAYGHSPHPLGGDRKQQILVASKKGVTNDYLERAINQTYYRTNEVMLYIKKLIKLDPESIIILVSDHLPHLKGMETYTNNSYLELTEDYIHKVRAYIIEGGEPKKYSVLHHYNFPQIIYNYLSDGAYCGVQHCFPERSTLISKYKKLIAHAAE